MNLDFKIQLAELVEIAQSRILENKFLTFEIPDEIKKIISQEIGLDCTQFKFFIDIYAIRHIFKEHGSTERETLRGQIAIGKSELLLIEKVLQSPDTVSFGGKNKLGKETLIFTKEIEGKIIIIKEVRTGKKMIALNSMRIIKTKRIT